MIVGRVWTAQGNPDPSVALFPNGTVAAKLIFTTASEAEVLYLKGSPQWQAYVYTNPNDPAPMATSPRAVLSLRLLQIDIAVKDDRLSDTTGWVFGTWLRMNNRAEGRWGNPLNRTPVDDKSWPNHWIAGQSWINVGGAVTCC